MSENRKAAVIEYSYDNFNLLLQENKSLAQKVQKLNDEGFRVRKQYMTELCYLRDTISQVN